MVTFLDPHEAMIISGLSPRCKQARLTDFFPVQVNNHLGARPVINAFTPRFDRDDVPSGAWVVPAGVE